MTSPFQMGLCHSEEWNELGKHHSDITLMTYPDSKVHGTNMGPICGGQDPGGPHVGPMSFVIWLVQNCSNSIANKLELQQSCTEPLTWASKCLKSLSTGLTFKLPIQKYYNLFGHSGWLLSFYHNQLVWTNMNDSIFKGYYILHNLFKKMEWHLITRNICKIINCPRNFQEKFIV